MYQLMIPILQRLEAVIAGGQSEKATHLQDLICGLLQVILIKIGSRLDDQLIANIIKVIIQMFTGAGTVTESGLIAFQGLVVGVGERITIAEIGEYIKFALESKDNDCIKIACGIIADLAVSLHNINDYIDVFVPPLLNILKEPTLDRSVKPPTLHALGEICFNSGDVFNAKYLSGTMTILDMAARLTSQGPGEDLDTKEFLSELRESILDQYITILMSAGDSGHLNEYSQFLESIFDFTEKTSMIEGLNNIKMQKQIIALLGDIATNYKGHQGVKQKATLPYIEQGILILQNQHEQEYKQQANFTLEAIKSIVAN